MQDQAVARAAEQSTAEENLSAQRGWLAIRAEAAGALKFSVLVEQQLDAPEGCFRGKKLLQAKIIGVRIVFQFGDAIFHVRSAVVVAPEFFRRERQISNEDAEGVARNLQQFSSQRGALGAPLFANHHEAARTVPAQQLQRKLTRSVMLVQGAPVGNAGGLALQPGRPPCHEDIGQPALLEKTQ